MKRLSFDIFKESITAIDYVLSNREKLFISENDTDSFAASSVSDEEINTEDSESKDKVKTSIPTNHNELEKLFTNGLLQAALIEEYSQISDAGLKDIRKRYLKYTKK